MNRAVVSFILGLLLSISAISQEEVPADQPEQTAQQDEANSGWKEINYPYNYQNLQVPREFFEFLKQSMRERGVSEKIIEDFSVLPISVRALIMSEDPLVLKDGLNYSLQYIEGGGNMDMFNFVAGKGAFRLRFFPEFPETTEIYMFYISDSPGKKVGDDQWGNECGIMYDISDKADLFIAEEGIRVTSSRRHYLHLMAGTFIFAQLVEERLFLGYIRLEDSRYPNFNCGQQEA